MATIDIKLKTYEQLQFEIMKLNTDIVLKDKEIKRLNKKYEDAVADYEEQKYIISELEKYIKTEISEDDFINSELCVNILDKLQELKEGK